MKSLSQLNEQNQRIEQELNVLQLYHYNLKTILNSIISSKAYRLWQLINQINPNKNNHQDKLPPILIKNNQTQHKTVKPLKKIAIFTDRLITGFGVDLVVHQQAQILSNNYDVTVFSIVVDNDFIEKSKYNVFKLCIPQNFNPIIQDINSLKYLFKHKIFFTSFDTFVIHTPTYHSWIPFLKNIGRTLIYYYGNSPSNNYSGFKKYRQKLLNILENYLYYPHADRIASISEYLSKQLSKSNQKKTLTIRLAGSHMTSVSNKISNNKKLQILEEYSFSSKDKYITYIGRLDYHNNPYKNTRLLIDIAKEVGAPKKNKVLAIGFPENNIQEELYENGVYSIANATPEELATFLSHSYLYCSPSLWEGFNLPLLEAQTLGIPVVAYDLPAHREIVINGKTGFLVKTKAEFIATINKLLGNPKLRNKMAVEAKKYASNFTWENNINNFKNLL